MSQLINYKTQSVDTRIEVERIQFARWRSLSLSQKAELVSRWTKGCWEMGLNAILSRYPDATCSIIRNKFAILTLGNTTAHWILAQDYQPPLMISDPISLALVVTDILNQLEISYLVVDPEAVLVLPTAEDIILQKLTWYKLGFGSEKQWRDILGVMKLQGDKLDFAYLSHWAETLGVLESLNRGFTQSGL